LDGEVLIPLEEVKMLQVKEVEKRSASIVNDANTGPFVTLVPAFLQDLLKGPHIGSRLEKKPDRLIQGLFGLVRGVSGAY